MSDYNESYDDLLDYISQGAGLGSVSSAMADSLVGINHRVVGNPVPYNQDLQGLTFFTRPRMNLSYNNLSADRRLSILAANNAASRAHYGAVIRYWLDPELHRAILGQNPAVDALVDPYMAFIPLLTNHLVSLSGWVDPIAETFEAKAGMAKETWGMTDGIDSIYSSFDLTANFRNIAGDPISLMFQVWLVYMSMVYQGRMLPYPDSEMLREVDYQTRIYRLVLDPSKRYVQKIAACGAAFPYSSALGQAFDFNTEAPFEQGRAQQISIPFKCFGAMYQDPILIQEFNDTVCMFNDSMVDGIRENRMIKIPPEDLNVENYYGYPRINIETNELEWWEFLDRYNQRISITADTRSRIGNWVPPAPIANYVPTP